MAELTFDHRYVCSACQWSLVWVPYQLCFGHGWVPARGFLRTQPGSGSAQVPEGRISGDSSTCNLHETLDMSLPFSGP